LTPAHRNTYANALTRCTTSDYPILVSTKCFEHEAATGGLSLVLYDVTALYFEAEKEDELCKVGYSKERRVNPEIVVGLLVGRTGFPLATSLPSTRPGSSSSSDPVSRKPSRSGEPFPLERERFRRRADHRHRHSEAREELACLCYRSSPSPSPSPSCGSRWLTSSSSKRSSWGWGQLDWVGRTCVPPQPHPVRRVGPMYWVDRPRDGAPMRTGT
jgi:hypothetical protein